MAPIAAAEEPQLSAQDIAEFDRTVGDASIIVFGEDSHEMLAVHQMVPELFKDLVRRKRVRLFVFESAWGVEDGLKDWMNSNRMEFAGDEFLFLNVFASEPIKDMLAWIRLWNRGDPHDPIRIAGYQPEQPVTDMTAIRGIAAKALPGEAAAVNARLDLCSVPAPTAKMNLEFVIAAGKRAREKKPVYTPEQRQSCLRGLSEIRSRFTANRTSIVRATSAPEYEEALLHILSLETYVGTLTLAYDEGLLNDSPDSARAAELSAKLYGAGDHIRFKIFEKLRQTRYGNAKTFFWMHNWHAMKNSPAVSMNGARMPSLGTRLAKRYGQRLVSIGNIVPCAPEWCVEPAGSVETPFRDRFGDKPAVVNFADREATKGLGIEKPGQLIPNLHAKSSGMWFSDVVLRDQFDGVIYLPRSGTTFKR